MADPLDEPGYAEGREGSGFLAGQPRRLDAPIDDEDIGARNILRTALPGLVLATGLLWILAGVAYIALFVGLRLLDVPFRGGDFWLILGAVFFVKDGVQLIRGRFRDPLGDGIVSIGVGIYFLVQAYFHFDPAINVITLMLDSFFVSIFVVPGILALLGRKAYLRWKSEQAT